MSRRGKTFVYLCSLIGIYILLVFLLPANDFSRTLYNLSANEYHELLFLISVPLIVVWVAAFHGYNRLREYAATIADTPEGTYYDQLALGTMWLAWGFPVTAIITQIVSSIANSHPGFTGTSNIIIDYVSMLIPLIAFTFISTGTDDLLSKVRKRLTMAGSRMIVLTFVLLGVLFCFFTFRVINLHYISSTNNHFYLPLWLLLITFIVPFLYAWFIGLLSAYEIIVYGRSVPGLLYRRPTKLLASGFVIVIASSIALEYVNAVTPRSGHLSLNHLLVTTYVIRFVAALGFLIIASGAGRLKKIEEV